MRKETRMKTKTFCRVAAALFVLLMPGTAAAQIGEPYIHDPSTIMKCEADVRDELFQNIVIAGGGAAFRGFTQRLAKELQKLAPDRKIDVWTNLEESAQATIIGGLKIAMDMETWKQTISKEELDKSGASLVHTRFPPRA